MGHQDQPGLAGRAASALCGDSTDPVVVDRLWDDHGPAMRMIWTDAPYGVVMTGRRHLTSGIYGRGQWRIATTPCRPANWKIYSLPPSRLQPHTLWLVRPSTPPFRASF